MTPVGERPTAQNRCRGYPCWDRSPRHKTCAVATPVGERPTAQNRCRGYQLRLEYLDNGGCLRRLAILMVLSALPLQGELLPIRTYTTTDGLASDSIYRIVSDSRGSSGSRRRRASRGSMATDSSPTGWTMGCRTRRSRR